MMARQHVPLSGLATLTIVSTLGGANPFIPFDGVQPFKDMSDPATLFVLTLIGQAFGMVPDIDHPKSTITKKLGTVGAILQPIISSLSGGHRKGAHSWVFVVAMGLLGALLSSIGNLDGYTADAFPGWLNQFFEAFGSISIWLIALFVTLCTAFSIRLILPQKLNKSGKLVMLASLGGGATVVLNPEMIDTPWLIFAMALGTLFHDVGDMMTTGKVPFLWPFYQKPLGLAVVGRTGSWREVFAVGPVLTFALTMSYSMVIIAPVLPALRDWMKSATSFVSMGHLDFTIPAAEITMGGALIVAAALSIFDLLTRVFFPPRFEGGH